VQTVRGKGYRFVAETNGNPPVTPDSIEERTPPKTAWSETEGSSGAARPLRNLVTTDEVAMQPVPARSAITSRLALSVLPLVLIAGALPLWSKRSASNSSPD
jgi:hypothetical protein